MQIWIASFIIIFALSQFWAWLQSLEYSLPVLALGGGLLAFVSNYDKRASLPFWPHAAQFQGEVEASSLLSPQTPTAKRLAHDILGDGTPGANLSVESAASLGPAEAGQ